MLEQPRIHGTRWFGRLKLKQFWAVVSRPKRKGWCPVCERMTLFVRLSDWLREDCRCARCISSARGRALVSVLAEVVPGWRQRSILEFAPYGPVSARLERQARGYVGSVYLPDRAAGEMVGGYRNEDLRSLTFNDRMFDVVISQDVFEHVFEPERGFSEIERILKPGGVHVFTVPYFGSQPSRIRARLERGDVIHLEPPEFHGDPVNSDGALVVTEWGEDLFATIQNSSGMMTERMQPHAPEQGIEGESLDVFVSRKPE
ncbi:class I SAM-dependent methyltransferase [Wenzhouxiangella sediminis]|uniref:Class I SAM-dependent methyltransferase n=1 Tax=Wenzhouxiangella sediminis TaxID=1792836 RepID=A0A3E1KC68_9GAMM|nr:class I SAM-dependent methyltransferase [Wenzhouxiangella sediminis]